MLFSSVEISASNEAEKLSTPSDSSFAVTASRLTPAASTCSMIRRAPSTSASTVRRTVPWSRKAEIVPSGIVFTQSGPISSST